MMNEGGGDARDRVHFFMQILQLQQMRKQTGYLQDIHELQMQQQEFQLQLQEELERTELLPKCPDCGSPLEFTVRRCRSCTTEIAWIEIDDYSIPLPKDRIEEVTFDLLAHTFRDFFDAQRRFTEKSNDTLPKLYRNISMIHDQSNREYGSLAKAQRAATAYVDQCSKISELRGAVIQDNALIRSDYGGCLRLVATVVAGALSFAAIIVGLAAYMWYKEDSNAKTEFNPTSATIAWGTIITVMLLVYTKFPSLYRIFVPETRNRLKQLKIAQEARVQKDEGISNLYSKTLNSLTCFIRKHDEVIHLENVYDQVAEFAYCHSLVIPHKAISVRALEFPTDPFQPNALLLIKESAQLMGLPLEFESEPTQNSKRLESNQNKGLIPLITDHKQLTVNEALKKDLPSEEGGSKKLKARCPECRVPFNMVLSLLGKKVKCKNCDHLFSLPDPNNAFARPGSQTALVVICPSCRCDLRMNPTLLTRTIRCGKCKNMFSADR
ncbi:MAG: hypothetical protein RL240_238 [Planctomycetota bacterium]|jgi:predicted Zn finger-like uncharacterized protein